ncbi:type I-F CRISPR-associated protein Csy1 [Salinicola salarius]|mgnify:CR=1 FL=1|uniref:type I-F CRISPR-associated protein Csy1 n=1 Tax=Salinicola salarius TaxID=430457 RepID=UPI0023E3679D|nr:type I-F CRISPR-associated protein Csy1 [Salinicola salarius]MDF3917798.1 type I-F CRISPR-associated protein Csy1 [Salinicola salarius]
MHRETTLTTRGESMLQQMNAHVQRRLDNKLAKFEGRTDAQAKSEIKRAHEKYVLKSILVKGASSAPGVAIATHIAKATHPDPQVKQVANLLIDFGSLPSRVEVGSHVLPDDESLADATGNGAVNSAAYELYLLLDIRFEGRKFSEWLSGMDQDALSAFARGMGTDDDSDVYSVLLNRKNLKVSTDARLKQVYWLVGDDPADNTGFRLLAPLYATSLTHRFYAQVSPNIWFYGDRNKAARKALRERTAFDGGYTSYPNLAVQKLGGTKPQNISQLNSERGGQSYLLASLPPSWQSRSVYPPMTESFRSFQRRPEVRRILNDLKRFLESDPPENRHTKNRRDALVALLTDELMLFALDIQALTPGWTIDEHCRLASDEQFWLDPARAELDAEFAAARRQSNWSESISTRAANWLNGRLNDRSTLNLGDNEHNYWKKKFGLVMEKFRSQVDDLQDALRDEGDEGEAA